MVRAAEAPGRMKILVPSPPVVVVLTSRRRRSRLPSPRESWVREEEREPQNCERRGAGGAAEKTRLMGRPVRCQDRSGDARPKKSAAELLCVMKAVMGCGAPRRPRLESTKAAALSIGVPREAPAPRQFLVRRLRSVSWTMSLSSDPFLPQQVDDSLLRQRRRHTRDSVPRRYTRGRAHHLSLPRPI